jgi:D-beta-D-heptose 7-phosphate kinase/D-beta-D-heptose 1-phosphate adenosyltransferase
MLDCYLWGTVDRISPEAPVPVVNIQRETWTLGGAANVANNLRKLEVEPILIGVAGNDDNSLRLHSLLRKWKISSSYLVTTNRRPTTIKTRIIAHSQQVVRADREETKEVSERTQQKILETLAKNLSKANAVIISDYGKGVVTYKLLNEIIRLAREKGLFIAVDPKETHFMNYKGASIITPNHHEAGFAYRKKIVDEKSLEAVGWGLMELLELGSVLITRGEKGMSLFEPSKRVTHLPTVAKEVYDVTGAGDTVIATLVAAKSAGATLLEAAKISNYAAGIVVGEVGTAQVTKEELYNHIINSLKSD